ncbi:META domain-containing protein [Dermatophilus congolensis]|uniref:Heat-inducible protein n=1 Tax=Dermatophilus congolensis TaxID=1863 RepID=A0AA46GZH7_9MICO|nr:META domain-containing protein [Dermatophilus congolensis]MBO3141924.1 META domain-containing protein [Dermatophilus congolensis]MBO3150918.1 META domain-containing protein [Dermatophilus congolensis]MBO3162077.1 META domain-containing protein [Dermatophilus congolensis]MBO3162198.1 META domain-containing protein [Dermatophilus congolensis]MBO3175754.1 META domain-containing protein [Dermatophilus congolensis]
MKGIRIATAITATTLVLGGAAYAAHAAVSAQDPVTGHSWHLVVPGVDSKITKDAKFTIKKDGTFEGEDACNHVFGKAKVADKTITTSNIATSQAACVDDKVNKVADVYHSIFEKPAKFEYSDKKLTLTTKDGAKYTAVRTD